jgi:hypothetical protein
MKQSIALAVVLCSALFGVAHAGETGFHPWAHSDYRGDFGKPSTNVANATPWYLQYNQVSANENAKAYAGPRNSTDGLIGFRPWGTKGPVAMQGKPAVTSVADTK